ncbi:hypothetical protein [Vallitalea guaymasensis]|uniref:hypothetical protein n=1 Tax=Vallitalea guaymasensis TaxID=1185412 RepID=UPI000DE55A7E|nr:hypothetical protein [Vallitalea guaymasensis]
MHYGLKRKHLVLFILAVVFSLILIILKIVVEGYDEEQIGSIESIVDENKHVVLHEDFIDDSIEKEVIKTPNEKRMNYLNQNEKIYNQLFDTIVVFNDYISNNNYEEAYNMCDDDTLDEYFGTYDVEQLKELIETIYKEFKPYDGPLIFNMSDYNKYDDYYICKVDVLPDHIGDEGLQSDVNIMVEFSLIMIEDEFKIIPYNLRQLDSIYKK